MANLVDVLHEKHVHLTIMSQDGDLVKELDVNKGNSKGLLVFTIGNSDIQYTDGDMTRISEDISKVLKSCLKSGVMILPYGVKVEYISFGGKENESR